MNGSSAPRRRSQDRFVDASHNLSRDPADMDAMKPDKGGLNPYIGVSLCAFGIISTLILYGILQERIMTMPYGDEGEPKEYFKYSLLIVAFNRLFTCLVAAVVLLLKGESLRPIAPIYAYAGVSISNVVATSCQYEALKYVSFPVQTLAKCCKMVPVMIWGTAINGKRYTWREYLMAVTVTGGCTLFLVTGDIKSKAKAAAVAAGMASIFGGLLMFGYLGFDGFTSTFQEKLFKGFQMSSQHQVMYVTFFSSFFALSSLVSAGMFSPAVAFVAKHPKCLSDILLLSSTAVASQFIIAHTIKTYGALAFATIMTTRQFLSILSSCILFGHPLSTGQWFGVLIVFGTLYAKIANKKKAAKGADASHNASDAHEKLLHKTSDVAVSMPPRA